MHRPWIGSLATAVLLAAALCASPLRGAAGLGPITRAHAEDLWAKLPAEDPWVKTPDGSTLAWGESHLLHALVDLYEATDDAKFLTEVARRGDRLLTHRDDRRGVVDGSGQSRPAWSMASKYVVADGWIVDPTGQRLVALRSTASAYNNLTRVTLAPVGGEKRGRFSLTITNAQFKREETFAEVSLDPADDRFVEKIVNAVVPTHSARPGKVSQYSNLVRVTVTPGARGVPGPQTFSLKPIPLAYMGYLGVIYHPMLRFAEIVRSDPRHASLVPAADRFVVAAEESYADANRRLWREGPGKDEGYYLCCARGESFPFDNVGEPFNYLGRHTASQLALVRLTGKPEYRERAERMARLFKNRLKLDATRDLYTWNYWYEPVTTTGWTPANSPSLNIPNYPPVAAVEDISHGVLDIAMVVSAHAAGVVFDETDVRRCANTLLTHVLNPTRTSVRRRVDGQGPDYPNYLPALAGWLALSDGNPEVYREIRRTAEAAAPRDFFLLAALLKWERRLTPRP